MHHLEQKRESRFALDLIQENFGKSLNTSTSILQSKSWLTLGHPLGKLSNLPWKLAALILGDGFIKDTPLEGSPSLIVLSHYLDLFPQLIQFAKNQKVQYPLLQKFETHRNHFFENLKEATQTDILLYKLISEGMGKSYEEQLTLIEHFVNDLHQKFLEKRKLWLYSGWHDQNNEGHAIILILDLDQAKVTVINSGDGLKYHPSAPFCKFHPFTQKPIVENRFQQFLTYRVNRAKLREKNFLQVLIEAKARSIWDGKLSFEAGTIYEPIKNLLGGRPNSPMNPNHYPLAYKKDQISGVCSFKVIATAYYYDLLLGSDYQNLPQYNPEGAACFKLEKFLWQTQLLTHFGPQAKDFTKTQKSFFNDFVENIARSIEKKSLKDLLSIKDLEECTSTLKDIQSRLSQNSNSIEIPAPLLTSRQKETSVEPYKITVPYTDVILSSTSKSGSQDVTSSTPQMLIEELVHHAAKPWNTIEELFISLDRINESLEKLVSWNRDDTFSEIFLSVVWKPLDCIKPFILSLPIPKDHADCFWKKIPEDQLIPCMERLYLLMKTIKSINRKQFSHDGDQTVMLYALYTINVELARKDPHSLLDGLKVNYIDLIWELRSPFFDVEDALLQIKLFEIIKYFKPKFTLNLLVSKNKLLQSSAKIDREPRELQALFSFKTMKVMDLNENIHIDDRMHNQFLINSETIASTTDQTILLLKRHLKRISDSPVLQSKLYEKKMLQSDNCLQPSSNLIEHLSTLMNEDFLDNDPLLPESIHLLKASSTLIQLHHYLPIESAIYPYSASCIRPLYRVSSNGRNIQFFPSEIDGKEYSSIQDQTLHNKYVIDRKNTLIEHWKALQGQNEDIVKQQLRWEKPLDVSRALEMLGNDPYQTISRCIGFMKKYPVLIGNPSIKDLLWIHIFSPGRLLAQLEADKSVLKKMNKVIKKLINHYIEANDLNTCLFLAKLGQKISLFATQSNFPIKIPHYRKIILEKILPKLAKSDDDKDECYRTIAEFYQFLLPNQQHFTPEIAIDLMRCQFSSRLYNLKSPSSLYRRLLGTLKDYLDGLNPETRDFIFNNVINNFVSLKNPYQWKAKSFDNKNEYVCSDYHINIESGTLIHRNILVQQVQLPKEFIDSHRYEEISSTVKSVELIFENEYLINKDLSTEMIIRDIGNGNEEEDDDEGEVRFQFWKKFQGKEYQRIDYYDDLNKCFEVEEHHFFWISHGSNPHIIITHHLEAKPLFYVELGQEISEEKENDKNKSKEYCIRRIYSCDENGNTCRDKFRIPFKHIPHHLHFLGNFEQTRFIECWVDTHDRLIQIKLTKLGLSFAVKTTTTNDRFYCSEYPGYFLVNNPEIEALERTPFFITLSNGSDELKIIIPHQELFVSYTEPFDRKIAPCKRFSSLIEKEAFLLYRKNNPSYDEQIDMVYRKEDEKKFIEHMNKMDLESKGIPTKKTPPIKDSKRKDDPSIPYETYQLTHWSEYQFKKDDQHLKPKTVDGQLYLLYLLVLQGDYCEGYKLLKTINPLERMVDDKSRGKQQDTFLKLIIKHLIQTSHPSGLALYLHLYAFIRSTTMKYPHEIGVEIEEFTNWDALFLIFNNYQKNKINTNIPLTLNEEKSVLEIILNKIEYHIYKRTENWSPQQLREGKHSVLFLKAFLNTKRINVGTRAITPIQKESYNFSLTNRGLRNLFDLSRCFLIYEKSFFQEYFYDLYWIAHRGTPAEKSKLKVLLDSARHKDAYIKVLNQVLKTPWLFPKDTTNFELLLKCCWTFLGLKEYQQAIFDFGKSFSDLISITPRRWTSISNQDSIQSVSLTFSNESLKEIDAHYNHFFADLVDQFFTSKEVSVEVDGDRLPTHDSDPSVEEQLIKENQQLALYRSLQPTQKTEYSLRPSKTLFDLYATLERNFMNLSNRLKTQKEALLWQINHIPENSQNRTLKEIHKIGFRKKLTWNEIRELSLSGDLKGFLKRTYLSRNEAELLLEGVSEYLVTSTRLHQMKSIMSQILKVKKAKNKEFAEAQLQYVPQLILAVRAYTPTDANVARHWFEFANHYHYRELQLKKIQEVMEQGERVLLMELPTNAGKTKTITATLDQLKADEGYLVVNTFPTPTEMVDAHDIQEQCMESQGRKVDRLAFDRVTQLSGSGLEERYLEILKDLKKKRPIVQKSEALRALELHTLLFIKAVIDVPRWQSLYYKSIESLLKILRVFRVKGWSSIDESHSTLDPRDQLIYSLGKPDIIPQEQVDIIDEIFQLITESNLAKLFEDNIQRIITDSYEETLSKPVASHFRQKFGISPEDSSDFYAFVLGKTDDQPPFLQNSVHRKQIILLRGLLSEVLKTSLDGAVDEDFGLSKLHIKTKEFAIPFYKANQRKENKKNPSQYKNPHVTLVKTYITYLVTGLSVDQVKKLVEFLKDQALKEAELGVPLHRTKSLLFFKKHAPEYSLLSFNEKDLPHLHKLFKKNRAIIFYYIRSIIVPQIKVYPNEIANDVVNFLSQFKSSLSMSATPQDRLSHSLDTFFIPMRGSAGKITHILLTKCKDPSTIHKLLKIKPEEVVDEMIEVQRQNLRFHATIDVGALTKGLTNKQVTEKLHKEFAESEHVKGIIYFNEETQLFQTKPTHEADESEISSDFSYAFFDQSRCEASDRALPKDALGFVTTTKGTKKSAVGQGAGRLRDIDNGQSIHVGYPDLIHKEVFGNDAVHINKLLVYWTKNGLKAQAEKNYEYQIKQMGNVLRRTLWDVMLGVDRDQPNVDLAISLVRNNTGVFFSSQSCDPELLYLHNQKERDTIQCLEDFKKKAESKVNAAFGLARGEKETVLAQLNRFPANWPNILLPKLSKPSIGLHAECEILQQVEIKVETQTQVQNKENIESYEVHKWPKGLNVFRAGWEKPAIQSILIRKIFRGIFKLSKSIVLGIKDEWHNASNDKIARIRHICFLISAGVNFYLKMPFFHQLNKIIVVALAVSAVVYLLFKDRQVGTLRMKGFMEVGLPWKLRSVAQIFTPNFLTSNNFYHYGQLPFDISQKPLYSVLVILDHDPSKNLSSFKIMAMDQNDSKFFHQKLFDDSNTDPDIAQARTRKIGIYDLENDRFIAQGKNQFSEFEIHHPQLAKLTAQAKFCNGSIHYTQLEQEAFRNHFSQINHVSKNSIRDLFYNHILPNYPQNLKLAQTADLGIGL